VLSRHDLTREEAAHEYATLGYVPIPIPEGRKGPSTNDWPRIAVEVALAGFQTVKEGNVGLRLGEAGGGLLDVDLDCAEAIAIAPAYLPATATIHGRASAKRSHWWYRADGACMR
jgi:hypothetical protein